MYDLSFICIQKEIELNSDLEHFLFMIDSEIEWCLQIVYMHIDQYVAWSW